MAETPFDKFIKKADSAPTFTGRPTVERGSDPTLLQTYQAGIEQGAEGLGADIEYFKALTNTLIGDEEAAASNIRKATQYEEFAANAVEGIQNFEQFLDEPTVLGFFEQVAKLGGQATPSLVTTVGTGGTAGVATVLGKLAIGKAGKSVAKRIAKDSIDRTIKGVATPDERDLANSLYSTFKKGAITGAFTAEYVPLSGQNLSEAINEAGQELDRGTALRAGTVALPQATIGVGSEIAVARLLGKIARRRSTKVGSEFDSFSKAILKNTTRAGVIEAATEAGQEGIAAINRFDMDPTYTSEEALLRIGEAAFGGFMGGGQVGVAGTTAIRGAQAVGRSGILDTTGEVVDRARRMVDDIREKRTNADIDASQYGDVMDSTTTPESQADINAQLKAMTDKSSSKAAVWVAGKKAEFKARTNQISQISIDGTLAFAAFIPGRGTIVSTNKSIVEAVVAAKATDSSLATALGYNANKSQVQDGDKVVQAIDKDGNVVSEEVTNDEFLSGAVENAEGLAPEGGRVNITTVEKALEERKKKFEAEKGPVVREMDDDAFDPTETDDTETPFSEQEGVQTVEGEETVTGTYKPKADRNQTFDNTEQARADFDSTFGEQDWGTSEFGEASESTLNEAVRQQRENINSVVSIRKNADGQFEVVRVDYDQKLIELRDPVSKKVYRVTEDQFLDRAIQIAKNSKFSQSQESQVTVVTPDGRRVKVNLVDLTRAGQRLSAARGDGQFEGQTPFDSAQRGLQEILAELQIKGYDVVVSGESILTLGNKPLPDYQGSKVATRIDGANVSLGDLLSARNTIPQDRPEAVIAEEVDSEGRPTGEIVGRQSGTDAAMDAFERFQRDTMGRETRRVNEQFDPADQVEETDGRSEVDRNLDQPETEQDAARQTDRRTGRAPTTDNQAEPTQPNRPEPEPPFLSDADEAALRQIAEEQQKLETSAFLKNFITDLAAKLKLSEPPNVYTLGELIQLALGPNKAEFYKIYGAEGHRIATAILRMRQESGLKGLFLELDGAPNVIIIRKTDNDFADALVTAHELGHALFRDSLRSATDNKALRQRLINGFKNDPRYKNYLEAYSDEGFDIAFEEWYADQVARWSAKKFIRKQAKNLPEKHFKSVAQRLRQLWRDANANLRKRMGRTAPEFEAYVEQVIEAKKANKDNPTFMQRQLVREVNDAVVRMGGEGLADHWRGKIREIARNPKLRPLMKMVRTADGIMRMHAGTKIANMFYVRSQDPKGDGNLGFVGASARKIADFQNDFEDKIGAMDDPEVQAALAEAATSKPTSELSEKAQAIRNYLDSVYDEYIAPSNTDIGRQENYFPTALNLMAIQENLDGFVELILQQDPTATEKSVRESIQAVLKYNQSVADGAPIDVDGTNPAAAVEKALKLTLNVDREVLQEAGFLHEPQDAFVQYLRHIVKRVEWNKHTKDEDGKSILDAELDKLDPEDRAVAEEVISTYLGYQTKPLSPLWRKVNSYGQFLQFVTILPFAAIASLPELAGPVINSKEFGGIVEGMKQVAATITNRAEARQFARDLGVVTNEVVANSWVTQAELDYMDPKVRRMSDKFFQFTGLQWFTTFTREFAAGMGTQFILKHAKNQFDNPRAERYLQELGLTKNDVLLWNDGGRKFTTPEGKKVKKALQRFVESSILRPNAAERPVWASDPHWALVWQLKSYFYAYSKVIMGGVFREMKTRRQELDGAGMPQLTATLSMLAITALATMPLAMLGMEIRELTKQGLAAVLPGVETSNKYFRTDRMDWPTYINEVIDKSGFLGIFTLGAMAHQNAKWDDKGIEGFAPDSVLPFLGPTAETVDTILENGFSIDRTLKNRLIPIYNQL